MDDYENYQEEDTIAALASAIGGGIAIVRVSGPRALEIGNKIWRGRQELSIDNKRQMLLGHIIDPETNQQGDQALAVYFKGPNSYTGEDVVELQCHGGAFVARHTLKACLKAGARSAEPGEYTKRAYINGRMDLTQAEAVMDLINARSEMAMHIAVRQLDGRLGDNVKELYEAITELHSEIEVRMDFIEEDLDWTTSEQVFKTLDDVNAKITKLLASQRDGAVLRNGIKAIIGGPPNAGKSSFLNHVLGHNRAIVTDIAGTTRDTLEEQAHIRGIPIRLIDTAGIRHDTDDVIERTGIERSLQALQEAQLIFWLIDLSRPLDEQMPPENIQEAAPTIIVLNKTDLNDDAEAREKLAAVSPHICSTSILKGEGLEELYDIVEKIIWEYPHDEEPELALNERHGALLQEAFEQISECRQIIEDEEWELVAINLRGSLDALGQIIGKTALPDILHNIFSKYCIGK